MTMIDVMYNFMRSRNFCIQVMVDIAEIHRSTKYAITYFFIKNTDFKRRVFI